MYENSRPSFRGDVTMKEKHFKSYEEFVDHYLNSHASQFKNNKNFTYFKFEPIVDSNKLHLNRWLLVQDDKGNLKIKFYSTIPKHKVVAYANVRKEV